MPNLPPPAFTNTPQSSSGGHKFGPTEWGQIAGAAGNMINNFNNDAVNPYNDAMSQYGQWNQQAANQLNPYSQAGSGMIPQYQAWLKSMQNPAEFQNQLMQHYQESPTAQYMQQQMVRQAQNAGSAEGTVGSTPYTQQVEQTAGNISEQDMNNWISNVLGINSQYGQGMGNMIGMGENAGNALSSLYGDEAIGMGDLAYNQGTAQNQQSGGFMSDLGRIGGAVGGFYAGGPAGALAGEQAGAQL